MSLSSSVDSPGSVLSSLNFAPETPGSLLRDSLDSLHAFDTLSSSADLSRSATPSPPRPRKRSKRRTRKVSFQPESLLQHNSATRYDRDEVLEASRRRSTSNIIERLQSLKVFQDDAGSSTSSSSVYHKEHVIPIDVFVEEKDREFAALRANDDELQILLFGYGDSPYKSLGLADLVSIGKILCKSGRSERAVTEDVLWVDVTNYCASDVLQLQEAFGLHPVTVDDITENGREKTEVFRKYSVVCANEMFYRPGSTAIDIAQTCLIIFPHLTLSFRSMLRTTAFMPVLHRLIYRERGTVPSTSWVMYATLDEILSLFQRFVEQIVEEVRALDDLVLILDRREQGDLLRRIAVARRRLATLRSTLWVKKELLESLGRHVMLMTDSTKAYIRDVLDDATSMLDRLAVSAEVLNHLDNIYLTRLNLEVAEAGEQMNSIMKKFSAVATIFIPLSTLTGLFGMNVQVPGQHEESLFWFAAIVAFMAVASLCMCCYFRRQGWF